ncbi:MAG: cell division protein FtsZ [Acidiferrobacterales bacterium]|nr:cell division protein FtsZ [Acidiferrobacterales bacterium]
MLNSTTPSLFEKRFFPQQDDAYNLNAIIKVIGVGGGGNNAVEYMINESIEGVEFLVANTDSQVLARMKCPQRIQIGQELTKGLGAGSDPEVGREAALEDKDVLVEHLKDADMVFVTAGLGGGTGTGAAPVIASAIKEAAPNMVVVAVVTTPFVFEGAKRMKCANIGVEKLKSAVDSLITIPNEKLLSNTSTMRNAYSEANDVLMNAVKGIADMVTQTGFINVDFADVRTVMSKAGQAVMCKGAATGENRATNAVLDAINNPLLDDTDVAEAKGILVNVISNTDMTPQEFSDIGQAINEVASDDAEIIMGQQYDDEVGDELKVTIIATGLGAKAEETETAEEPQAFAEHEPAEVETEAESGHEYESQFNGFPSTFVGTEIDDLISPVERREEPAVLRTRFSSVVQPVYENSNGHMSES